MKIFHVLFLVGLFHWTCCAQQADYTQEQSLKRWFTTETRLPDKLSLIPYVAYNSNSQHSDCIFVFGANSCSKCIYCFNITSSNVYKWDELTFGGYSFMPQASAMTDDGMIYFITNDNIIKKYDSINKFESIVFNDSSILENSTNICLTLHSNVTNNNNNNKTYLKLFLTSDDTRTWVYDINESKITQLDSFSQSRHYHSCIINSYDELNPYLYVLGGNDNLIERLNINCVLLSISRNSQSESGHRKSGNSVSGGGTEMTLSAKTNNGNNNNNNTINSDTSNWENLTVTISNVPLSSSILMDNFTQSSDTTELIDFDNVEQMAIASYGRYVYLFGGIKTDGSVTSHVMYLDVEKQTVAFIDDLPQPLMSHRAIATSSRIYIVGGMNEDMKRVNATIYSNELYVPTAYEVTRNTQESEATTSTRSTRSSKVTNNEEGKVVLVVILFVLVFIIWCIWYYCNGRKVTINEKQVEAEMVVSEVTDDLDEFVSEERSYTRDGGQNINTVNSDGNGPDGIDDTKTPTMISDIELRNPDDMYPTMNETEMKRNFTPRAHRPLIISSNNSNDDDETPWPQTQLISSNNDNDNDNGSDFAKWDNGNNSEYGTTQLELNLNDQRFETDDNTTLIESVTNKTPMTWMTVTIEPETQDKEEKEEKEDGSSTDSGNIDRDENSRDKAENNDNNDTIDENSSLDDIIKFLKSFLNENDKNEFVACTNAKVNGASIKRATNAASLLPLDERIGFIAENVVIKIFGQVAGTDHAKTMAKAILEKFD